mmetsp:Transcript_88418/g.270633  ORF Transcript_88418/g.270633 Transcript_88418/m.270633 type:complete len:346 (-) Transcript_88418:265-1302(-)
MDRSSHASCNHAGGPAEALRPAARPQDGHRLFVQLGRGLVIPHDLVILGLREPPLSGRAVPIAEHASGRLLRSAPPLAVAGPAEEHVGAEDDLLPRAGRNSARDVRPFVQEPLLVEDEGRAALGHDAGEDALATCFELAGLVRVHELFGGTVRQQVRLPACESLRVLLVVSAGQVHHDCVKTPASEPLHIVVLFLEVRELVGQLLQALAVKQVGVHMRAEAASLRVGHHLEFGIAKMRPPLPYEVGRQGEVPQLEARRRRTSVASADARLRQPAPGCAFRVAVWEHSDAIAHGIPQEGGQALPKGLRERVGAEQKTLLPVVLFALDGALHWAEIAELTLLGVAES